MDIQRALLITGIAIVGYLLILSWQEDYGGVPESGESVAEQSPSPSSSSTPETGGGQADVPNSGDVPDAPAPQASTEEVDSDDLPTGEEDSSDSSTIQVTTDVLQLEIDRRGGDIVRLALPEYPRDIDTPDQPFVLLKNNRARTYIAQNGLVGEDGTDSPEGRPTWQTDRKRWTLDEGEKQLQVDLYLQQDSGAEIIKRYTFERGSYRIRVDHIVRNRGDEPWQGAVYGQIKRGGSDDPGVRTGLIPMPTYLGAAYWTEDTPYNKLDFGDIRDDRLTTTQPGGWIAMVQHYFVSAWVPEAEQSHTYEALYRPDNDRYLMRFVSPSVTVAPGEEQVLESDFYAGPKIQRKLEALSPGLNMTVDYGWLWFISEPIFHVLVFLQSGKLDLFGIQFDLGVGVGNWGVAIILLTLLIKLLFFKLSATSYRSMAKMRKVAPEMNRIREEYKNDRQKQSQELMKLYQKEKINPLGGCLPILVQMPVFIALYYVLLESVELRHAPFVGWIQDLSAIDPYFVLPLLMGASMFLQTKLNPTPPDPTQAKIMKWMPIVFTVFFLWFPSGLVLYWLTNNLLSIGQQYLITRKIEREGA